MESTIHSLVDRFYHRRKCPPCESGLIPWVGVAIPFGKAPLEYIEKARRKHGNIFTLRVAGKWMTFIFGTPDTLQTYFFKSKHIDFQAAVQPFTFNAAGVRPESFSQFHQSAHDLMKGKLSSTTNVSGMLKSLHSRMSTSIAQNLASLDSKKLELFGFVRKVLFRAQTEHLFGNLGGNETGWEELFQEFFVYDEQFEYGAELPSIFLPKWADAKAKLLARMQKLVSSFESQPNDDANRALFSQELARHVTDDSKANFLLLFLWASNANAVPISFWTLAYILSDDNCLGQVLGEVRLLTDLLKDKDVDWLQTIHDTMKFTRQCVFEVIRLRSPGMIPRKVVEDFEVNGLVVPKGHYLMLSPYWNHRHLYSSGESFMPSRWEGQELNNVMNSSKFLAFGGGRYQCPGRYFAIAEILLFLHTVFSKYSVQPVSKAIPDHSFLHLVGTQEPTAEYVCSIEAHT